MQKFTIIIMLLLILVVGCKSDLSSPDALSENIETVVRPEIPSSVKTDMDDSTFNNAVALMNLINAEPLTGHSIKISSFQEETVIDGKKVYGSVTETTKENFGQCIQKISGLLNVDSDFYHIDDYRVNEIKPETVGPSHSYSYISGTISKNDEEYREDGIEIFKELLTILIAPPNGKRDTKLVYKNGSCLRSIQYDNDKNEVDEEIRIGDDYMRSGIIYSSTHIPQFIYYEVNGEFYDETVFLKVSEAARKASKP